MSSDNSKKKIVKLAIALVIVAAVFVGIKMFWNARYPHATWRYKMTVNVETPEGLKSGYAVREVSAERHPQLLGAPTGGHVGLKQGEAVVVDLGKSGKLFAILRDEDSPDYGHYIVFKAFPGPPGATLEGIEYYTHLKNVKATLTPDQYPMLVKFKDINDPKTVEKIDPPNLEQSLGKGVKLKSIELEMVDEPVTWSIDKYLPWLNEYIEKGMRLNGSASIAISTNELSDNLGTGPFQRKNK